jgi:Rv0078B-related antitoxin
VAQGTTPGDRLHIAFELADAGITIMRENLRRRNPDASAEEVEVMLKAWLTRRPPDSPGRSRPLSTL